MMILCRTPRIVLDLLAQADRRVRCLQPLLRHRLRKQGGLLLLLHREVPLLRHSLAIMGVVGEATNSVERGKEGGLHLFLLPQLLGV